MRPTTKNEGYSGFAPPGPRGLARFVNLPYLFGIIVLLISGSRAVNYWIQHTTKSEDVQIALWRADSIVIGDLESDLLNAETNQRGYLLTGDQDFLGPYNAATAQIRPEVEQLSKMVAAGRLSADDAQHLKDLIQ